MKSLRARISTVESADRRHSPRWRVELLVSLGSAPRLGRSVVRNLSEDGMLLETEAGLGIGDTILVDLPGADQTEARIVWRQDSSFGCAFSTPIPSAVISAALLQAPPDNSRDVTRESQYEEFPIAISPSVDELVRWKSSFDNTMGEEGYRIVAYRQAGNGLIVAIATKEAAG